MAGLWFEGARLEDGWAWRVRIAVREGRIVAITPNCDPRPGDERHGYALPGLANLHSHAFQRAMAGRAERGGPANDSFWSWRTTMYNLASSLAPEDLEAIAGMAFAEMLEAGFTRVGEFHYLHRGADGAAYDDPAEMSARIVAAAEAAGIGLTLLPVFYAHAAFGGAPPAGEQRRFVHDLDGYGRLLESAARALATLPDAVLGVAPHSLRAVTEDELRGLLQLRPAGPVHIHIAEQVKEVEDCLAWSGARPLDWLFDHVGVDANWCLVHATHAEPGELRRIAASGAVVGLCPITEANLGDGVFPAGEFLAHGGRFGVGSDSNVLIDAAEELRLLEYGQRLARRRRNVLAADAGSSGEQLFAHVLKGGAQALGAAPDRLAVGADATFMSLDARHPAFIGGAPDDLLDRWIFAARAPAVDCVWRGGRKLVAEGRHLRRDALQSAYADVVARMGA